MKEFFDMLDKINEKDKMQVVILASNKTFNRANYR